MVEYHRLTSDERYLIRVLKGRGSSIREIGRTLSRTPSTISRELKRNSSKFGNYSEWMAQLKLEKRRIGIGPSKIIFAELKRTIDFLLKTNQWSPQQIAGRLKTQGQQISHETIYQYIYRDTHQGGVLFKNLRRKRRLRRSHKSSRRMKNTGIRVNQRWIDERPLIVEKRTRLGDFERDTVLGKKGSPILLTIVDRATRFTCVSLIAKLNARLAHRATLKLLSEFKVRTITNDNGPEFALHKETAKALGIKIYFNHPYSSWERGTNENTNGLIRQYYPKGTDFRKVTKKQIKELQDRLNSRPRKCLGYMTPQEVYEQRSQSVALST